MIPVCQCLAGTFIHLCAFLLAVQKVLSTIVLSPHQDAAIHVRQFGSVLDSTPWLLSLDRLEIKVFVVDEENVCAARQAGGE